MGHAKGQLRKRGAWEGQGSTWMGGGEGEGEGEGEGVHTDIITVT